MCQCQLSRLTLPSEAAMPPCAATVCERVGNTLDSTATFSPACASCNAARIPEPPAPTTTTSKVRFVIAIIFLINPVVIPAQAGIQIIRPIPRSGTALWFCPLCGIFDLLDSRLRGNDDFFLHSPKYLHRP